MTRTLNGTASLTGTKGALTGLNVEQLLRRLERRPLSGGSEFRSGRTPFEKFNVQIKITQGNGGGRGCLARRTCGAARACRPGLDPGPRSRSERRGEPDLVAAAPTAAAFELPFVVQGAWDDPIMLPDPQILIRRSGAAAPLLDAVRERRAREAVRSAVERLGARTTAPGQAPAPTEPAVQKDPADDEPGAPASDAAAPAAARPEPETSQPQPE